MNIIKPSFSIEQCLDYKDALRVVEAAGRVCYKSEDKATEDSAEAFVKSCIKRKHDTLLEHISATVRFITSRGVSHEFVRHRIGIVFSQESTRFCNYGGTGINVIQPYWITDEALAHVQSIMQAMRNGEYDCNLAPSDKHYDVFVWLRAMEDSERHYNTLLERGLPPQAARGVLPTDLKTELVVTANFREWRHIFNLRVLGTTGKPHPDIEKLLRPLLVHWLDYPAFFTDLVTSE